ncbi:MAG: AzlC family ABC transporter permease [Clostridiales bacterium]|nr:AzlC family ABC transporter permease [Clostridiales bacterium]
MRKKAKVFRRAFPVTLPVLAGYIFLGIAYGIAMKARGFSAALGFSISTFVYGGSLQFAMIEPLCSSFAPVTFAFLCLLIQARHLFYGLTMLEAYSRTGKVRPYLVFSLTDETYSIVCQGPPQDLPAESWYAAISVLNQTYWVTGTLLGAMLGSVMPMEHLEGIDFSMTALFLVILTEQIMDALGLWRKGKETLKDSLFSSVLGAAATVGSLLIFGKESFLLSSMAFILFSFGAKYRIDRGRGAL